MSKDVAVQDAIAAYDPNTDDWDSLSSLSDVVTGSDFLKNEALDRLMGVPFIVTRVTFREGVQRPKVPYRDDYVSVECVVAPLDVLRDRVRKGRLDLDMISVEPGEQIGFNDGSTGIYRQIMQYLVAKELVTLPEPITLQGAKGECSFDLPRSQWTSGADAASQGINVRLKCPRGLRFSDYANEYNPDGSRTRYIA